MDNEVLEQLRNLIAPQVLRRMKHDVADLPEKIEVNHCKILRFLHFNVTYMRM